ncbi:COX15-CtaA-domain-containing protein [Gonapodya prolifera JEL478]|uniref:COX15-CtaA-domain-containing protein n=1 Tax=Gonapodya prolifera (strain JEL478) TaxID=1344416 RepID=A0A139B133_GONPJ|nr:COX15-CtaA-domain-containing protein [Gonapodya prolifera JEL478]|eukprot:KXS22513.1 COX15-CtaA-domain-containing protein [Gonapodya prolifera JEL478]
MRTLLLRSGYRGACFTQIQTVTSRTPHIASPRKAATIATRALSVPPHTFSRSLFSSSLHLRNSMSRLDTLPSMMNNAHLQRTLPGNIYISTHSVNFIRKFAAAAVAANPSDTESSSTTDRDPNSVAYWLLTVAALTYGIIVLGGLTRLTESGLSITEWNLIKGMKAPSSEQEWQEEFAKYKETPEYKVLNHHMTMPEFKRIFYYEWAHRLWGRAIGLAFLVPLGYFLARGKLSRPTATKAIGLGSLIGFQGFLGWYMVRSGLDPQHVEGRPIPVPRVSQHRLAAHLMTAFLVYGGCVWMGFDVLRSNLGKDKLEALRKQLDNPALRPLRRYGYALLSLVFITAFSGALVAGLDAGLVYNEWPLMGGRVVPSDMWNLTDAKGEKVERWRNLVENPSAVQFDHRMLAYSTLASSTALFMYGRRLPIPRPAKAALHAVMALAYCQAALGIFTLLYLVPIPLASAHQAGSVAVYTAAVWLVQAMKAVPK